MNNTAMLLSLSFDELCALKTDIENEIEKREKERIRTQYERELNDLIRAIHDDGFYLITPDYPSTEFEIGCLEDEEED